MFDVIVDGVVIARAETEQESEIYKLFVKCSDEQKIADFLGIQVETVRRYTDSGKYR